MIDLEALRIAIRARLTGDATLAALVSGVFFGYVPSTVTWTLPAIEFGWQADDRDSTSTYGRPGQDLRLRLMVHDKGPASGVGSFTNAFAVIKRADTVLLASPLVVSGQNVWGVLRIGGVPATTVPDEGGYPRMAVGNLYQLRSYE